MKFRRQYLIDGYLIDSYCHELKLAIEIDGGVHFSEDQIKYDKERQKIIERYKIKFFRISSKDVELNINKVLEKLNIFTRENFNSISLLPRQSKREKGRG